MCPFRISEMHSGYSPAGSAQTQQLICRKSDDLLKWNLDLGCSLSRPHGHCQLLWI